MTEIEANQKANKNVYYQRWKQNGLCFIHSTNRFPFGREHSPWRRNFAPEKSKGEESADELFARSTRTTALLTGVVTLATFRRARIDDYKWGLYRHSTTWCLMIRWCDKDLFDLTVLPWCFIKWTQIALITFPHIPWIHSSLNFIFEQMTVQFDIYLIHQALTSKWDFAAGII